MPHPAYLYLMKNLLIAFLFNFLCLAVQGATLDFAFQLGEKQEPPPSLRGMKLVIYGYGTFPRANP